MKDNNFVKQCFSFLNANVDYAVLRNFVGLPEVISSRDIDIIIEASQFKIIESKLIDIAKDEHYLIFSYYFSEKVCTYVFGKITETESDFIQFDFFFNTSIFGLLLCEAKTLLGSKEFNGSVYHVSKEFEFLDKYLQLKTLGREYPEKYAATKEAVVTSSYLHKVVGVNNVEDVDEIPTGSFRFKLLKSSLRYNGMKQIYYPFKFLYYYTKNNFFYKGFSLSLTGPDGAGKTSVIELLSSRLSQVYSAIEYYHYRPAVLPNLGVAAKAAKIVDSVDINYTEPHRGKKTNVFSSMLRYCYYSLDYIIGYLLRVRPLLSRRSLVVFDRYHTDILTDSRRSRIYLNYKCLTRIYNLIIPKMDFTFFITAQPEIILERKQELTKESIILINERIQYLSKNIECKVIYNDGIASDAVFEILHYIGKSQHAKYNKYK